MKSEARYRDVAAILNSSSLEFWFKQVCFPKGGDKVGEGRTPGEAWEERYVRNGTNVLQAPLPYQADTTTTDDELERGPIVAAIETALKGLAECVPARVFAQDVGDLADRMVQAQRRAEALRERLVGLQEELDWNVYGAFGLLTTPPRAELDESLAVARGHRPFEIALARRIAAGEEESAWFERHGLTPVTELPARYSGVLRTVLEQRLALIDADPNVALVEQSTSGAGHLRRGRRYCATPLARAYSTASTRSSAKRRGCSRLATSSPDCATSRRPL